MKIKIRWPDLLAMIGFCLATVALIALGFSLIPT